MSGFLVRLHDAVVLIGQYLPTLALALLFLFAGYLVARLMEWALEWLLKRIRFDRLLRGPAVDEAIERAGLRLLPSAIVGRLGFWLTLIAVLVLTADLLGMTSVTTVVGDLASMLPGVGTAVVVLLLGIVFGEFLKEIILASAGQVSGVPALAQAARIVVVTVAGIMALEQLNIAVDILIIVFIAATSAVALAVGLAFGLGGRDVAARVCQEWYDHARRIRAEIARQKAEKAAREGNSNDSSRRG